VPSVVFAPQHGAEPLTNNRPPANAGLPPGTTGVLTCQISFPVLASIAYRLPGFSAMPLSRLLPPPHAPMNRTRPPVAINNIRSVVLMMPESRGRKRKALAGGTPMS